MTRTLSRAQAVAILREPRRPGIIKALAKRFRCSEDFIRHIRHNAKFLLVRGER